MAQPTNTFDTFTAVGIREDLADIIYDISPTETPFMSNIARTSATQRYHEWQTDSLAAASSNRQIEGGDATAQAQTPTTRPGNRTQISWKSITVSESADKADKAGRGSEMGYLIAKAGRELKRDMEWALTRNQASTNGGSATANSLGSLESWLSTNNTHLGTDIGTTPGFASGVVAAPTDGTQATISETNLKNVISDVWTSGGEPGVIMTGAKNKERLSGFSGIATNFKNVPQGQATIVGAADLYVSDFGEHQIVPNRFSRDRTVLVLDMSMWAMGVFRDIQQKELARTGDAEKRMIVAEYTLVARDEASSGKIADCVT